MFSHHQNWGGGGGLGSDLLAAVVTCLLKNFILCDSHPLTAVQWEGFQVHFMEFIIVTYYTLLFSLTSKFINILLIKI